MGPKKPKTTPQCEQLLELVLAALRSNPIEGDKHRAAFVALKRLKKLRCAKALEYIIQVSSGHIFYPDVEINRTAVEYLDEIT